MKNFDTYLNGLSRTKGFMIICINVLVLLVTASFGPDSTTGAILERGIFQRILFVAMEAFVAIEIAAALLIAFGLIAKVSKQSV
jgi:hypothetical protein